MRRTQIAWIVLAWLGSGWAAAFATADSLPIWDGSDHGVLDHPVVGILIGGGLILLGLVGGGGGWFRRDRRRLLAERETLQTEIAVLNERRREMEVELTKQQQGLEALRDSEQRFRTLTQQLPIGIFLTDAQGQCRYVNDRWCRLTGLTTEQAIGLAWTQVVHPDDRDPILQAWRQAIESGAEFVADHRFRSPSGRVNWLNTRAVPLLDRAGRLNGYLGVNADIAELKKTEETLRASEARFRSYFDLPLIGIALTGPDKRWWEVNDRLCEILTRPK